ncbi:Predicted hydrolase of the alpha/beta superfamily [Neolewinella agarilytica]|uniref:Predicted hydrolase of the alpha/beta superfamily n=2 Tax=Neolewinella agarilytica TaxID=478744 RepID=A0A1H9K3K3_9BACT|nr:Predicted hydrolase of the alpha/beta superfamily [Neolewinella agarilytica]
MAHRMRSFLSLLLLTILCTCVRAQKDVTFGQQYTLPSTMLAEDRVLNVLLPREYADSTAKEYPVIYLLDGAASEDFFHVAGLVRYYQDHHMMPPTILVGIANTDRKRDMTYPSSDPRDRADFPTTGGSARFIEFLQKELTNWTETTFRTTEHRTLVGQSLAGLLATEVLLKYPGHYDDYIIISPSLWWDREGLYQRMDSLTSALTDLPQRVFLSAGTEYPVMVNGSQKLARLLEDRTDATFLHLPAEDHNTILHEALNRAFDQWYDPTVIRPYHFANAWNGLNIRSAPSLDSAVVGKLDYGASLGIIRQQEEETVIDGLSGKWTFIGSDIGRGWVFDAYVSPVGVFTQRAALADYAKGNLFLDDSLNYSNHEEEDHAYRLNIRKDDHGNQLVKFNQWETCWADLRLAGLNESQAQVTTENWLRCEKIDVGLLSPRKIHSDVVGTEFFYREKETNNLADWSYVRITFVQGVLSIKQSCLE